MKPKAEKMVVTFWNRAERATVKLWRHSFSHEHHPSINSHYACTLLRWDEMRWDEMKRDERWDEMRWDERWDEMRLDEMRDEMRWDEMRWDERWDETRRDETRRDEDEDEDDHHSSTFQVKKNASCHRFYK